MLQWFKFKEYQKHDYYVVWTPTQPALRFGSRDKANKYLDNYVAQNPHLARFTRIDAYDEKDIDEFSKRYKS